MDAGLTRRPNWLWPSAVTPALPGLALAVWIQAILLCTKIQTLRVELPDQGGIGVLTETMILIKTLCDRSLRLLYGSRQNGLVERSQLLTHFHGVDLHLARPLHLIHPEER